jgi:iron-sulfur cluster assembly protein
MRNILKQKALCRITDTATKKLQELLKITYKESLAKGTQETFFPRLSVIQKGCNGLSYKLCFISSQQKQLSDILIPTTDPSVHLLIDKKSVLYLAGVEIDYRETEIESQFLFKNANQKTSCGCGKSFSV